MPYQDPVALLTLRTVRRFIARSHARVAVVFFALLYALGAMTWGGMLDLVRTPFAYSIIYVGYSGVGGQAWNYPGLVITAPWGVITLPFFATVTMLVSAVGVGIGMTVAFLLVVRLIRPQSQAARQSATVGTLSGLTPAMLSLVTLGACCSTTGVATAGVGLIAAASGTSVAALLLNNWYLGVFQVAAVWVALLAQELLLVVYGGLFGLEPLPGAARSPPRYDRRFVVGASLRGVLFAAGFIWLLGPLADWTSIAPLGAGAGMWFRWVFQHEILGSVALGAALFPVGASEVFGRVRQGVGRVSVALVLAFGLLLALGLLLWLFEVGTYAGLVGVVVTVPVIAWGIATWARPGAYYVLGGFTLVAALATLLWVPSILAAGGVDPLFNQLLGALGAPASWGATGSNDAGLSLYLRWALLYGLLGLFGALAVLDPRRAFRPLLWTVGRPVGSPAAAPLPPPTGAGAPEPSIVPDGALVSEATREPGSAGSIVARSQ
jgi:hypothetical protein